MALKVQSLNSMLYTIRLLTLDMALKVQSIICMLYTIRLLTLDMALKLGQLQQLVLLIEGAEGGAERAVQV
jgi:hypothetical protein